MCICTYWDSGDFSCVCDAGDENLEIYRRVRPGIAAVRVDTAGGIWDKILLLKYLGWTKTF